MAAIAHPSIDFTLIGEADKRNLCSAFLEAVQRFYDDPANRDRFERWKQKQRETHKPATVSIHQ